MQGGYSIIRQDYPLYYSFFLDYWAFIKQYWSIHDTDDWWNCLISDLHYYIAENDNNDFCVDLLMAFYVRTRDLRDVDEPLDKLKIFLSEWWEYINRYFKPIDEPETWGNFFADTKQLSEKYLYYPYYIKMIDAFVTYKTKGNAEWIDDIR